MAAKSKNQIVDAKFFLVLVDESEELHQALYYASVSYTHLTLPTIREV